MAQLTENVRVHFPLCFQDEGIIAANSLKERNSRVELKVLHICNKKFSGWYNLYRLHKNDQVLNGNGGKQVLARHSGLNHLVSQYLNNG